MNKYAIVLFACLNFCLPGQAENFNSDLKAYCGPESLADARIREQLAPWFFEIDNRICGQTKYPNVATNLLAKVQKNSTVICWVSLDAKGTIKQAKLNSTTGSEALDRSILDLVNCLSPIKPPSSLDCPEHIQTEFRSNGSSITVSTQLNTRFLRGRIGQQ